MRNHSRSFWFAAFLCLCACGGGGSNGSPALGPQPAPAGGSAASAWVSVLLGAQPANATLPVIAQITGTLRFPAVGFADTLTLSASTAAPAGIGSVVDGWVRRYRSKISAHAPLFSSRSARTQ